MAIHAGVGRALGEDSFKTARTAIQQALKQLATKSADDPDLLLVFASVKYDQNELMRGIKSVSQAPMIGSSTAGEITQDGPSQQTVVVMALTSDSAKFTIGNGGSVSDQGSHDAGAALGRDILSQDKKVSSVVIFPDVLVGQRIGGWFWDLRRL